MTTTFRTPPPSPPVLVAPPTPPDDLVGDADLSAPDRPDGQPRWVRPALVALLVATAVAYLWDLSASGYANSFYAAAVQAGTKSWKAFFFGSMDSSNFITVDKSPGSLWVMELSGRLFGFSSWSMLVPQVLEGVAAVGLVYAAVKRWFGPVAGLVAGASLACTPVAALMFRFNNPDALMVLLLVAAAYALVRALERAGTRWIVATGALIGFAFLAKMLQSFTVLPAFVGVYLLAAPTRLRRRVGQLAIMGASVVVAAGWWVAAVALWPVSSRPFIDGSPDNSIINLILGYNGLERLSGGSGQGGGFSGATGVFRLFNDLMGGQASWLLPAALLALVAGVAVRWRAPRTDRTRAAFLLWGGWLVVTGAVFSFSSGVIHTYYTVALAPAVAALVGMGGGLFWRYRRHVAVRVAAAVAVVGTSLWAFELLGRTSGYVPWLRWPIVLVGLVSGVLLLAAPSVHALADRLTGVALGLGLVAALSGPIAYTATTITTAHTGSIPSAGPAITTAAGGFGGGGAGVPGGTGAPGATTGQRPTGVGGTPPTGAIPSVGTSAGGSSAPG
ncbi:MAG TPA: glycosyltransferase family 39 protein, partial [Acidimicrobiales bacterium]|nr:glycosyltransferase family 39 protein [Acidimicrobiales bacterium]